MTRARAHYGQSINNRPPYEFIDECARSKNGGWDTLPKLGWTGSFLDVDLSTGSIARLKIRKDYYSSLLGGANLGARLLLDMEVYRASPLDPGNVLLWLTGPITGTNFPGAGRTHVMARSPLTWLIGESNLGGYLGASIKLAGYDGLILRGKASRPCFLEIDGIAGKVLLHAADDLWGMDTYNSDEALRKRYPGRSCNIACIGPAGERQVPLASIVHNRHYIAARTGMGAVMGSKNLKAIVAFARGRMELADPQAYRSIRKECVDILQQDYWSQRRKDLGTIGNLQWAVETGRAPTKNWQNVEWSNDVHAITGQTLADRYLVGGQTCHGCPIVCKRIVEVHDHPQQVEQGPGPEYETSVSLGAMLLNHDLPALLKANELCNRLGIDTISVGGTLAWAMEAYQKGLLQQDWLNGHHPKWGDAEEIIKLIKKIGMKDGSLGRLLGSGSAAASRHIGRGSEAFAIHVKGLELGYHHPRVARGMEITYATNPRGAVHTESPDVFQHEKASYQEWVKQIARTADQSALPNAYVLCMFNCMPLGLPLMARLVSAITGELWDEDDLSRAAERGWYLKRIFNLHCGAGKEADTLPARIQEQIRATGIDHDDFRQALDLFHQYRQLDSKGIPAEEKLLELGLKGLDAGLKRE